MDRCSNQDARKMMNDLKEAVFTTYEMRLHSMTGVASNRSKAAKPPLAEDKVFAIIGMSLMYLFCIYISLASIYVYFKHACKVNYQRFQ